MLVEKRSARERAEFSKSCNLTGCWSGRNFLIMRTDLGLRPWAVRKTSGTVFPIRTSRLVNNMYIMLTECFEHFPSNKNSRIFKTGANEIYPGKFAESEYC